MTSKDVGVNVKTFYEFSVELPRLEKKKIEIERARAETISEISEKERWTKEVEEKIHAIKYGDGLEVADANHWPWQFSGSFTAPWGDAIHLIFTGSINQPMTSGQKGIYLSMLGINSSKRDFQGVCTFEYCIDEVENKTRIYYNIPDLYVHMVRTIGSEVMLPLVNFSYLAGLLERTGTYGTESTDPAEAEAEASNSMFEEGNEEPGAIASVDCRSSSAQRLDSSSNEEPADPNQKISDYQITPIKPPQRENSFYIEVFLPALKSFEKANKFTPNAQELWTWLIENQVSGYTVEHIKSKNELQITGFDNTTRRAFNARHQRYYPSLYI
jgi:hypothetical protein